MRTFVFIFFLFACLQLVFKSDANATHDRFSSTVTNLTSSSEVNSLPTHHAFISTPGDLGDAVNSGLTEMEDDDDLSRKFSLLTTCALAFTYSFLLPQPEEKPVSHFSCPNVIISSATALYIAQRVIRI